MAFGPCPSTGDWFHRALGAPKPSYSHQPCTRSHPIAACKGSLLEPLGADWVPKAAKVRPKVAKVHPKVTNVHPKVTKVHPKVTKVCPEVDHKAPNTEKS
mgnify:CR=1 FL=1